MMVMATPLIVVALATLVLLTASTNSIWSYWWQNLGVGHLACGKEEREEGHEVRAGDETAFIIIIKDAINNCPRSLIIILQFGIWHRNVYS